LSRYPAELRTLAGELEMETKNAGGNPTVCGMNMNEQRGSLPADAL